MKQRFLKNLMRLLCLLASCILATCQSAPEIEQRSNGHERFESTIKPVDVTTSDTIGSVPQKNQQIVPQQIELGKPLITDERVTHKNDEPSVVPTSFEEIKPSTIAKGPPVYICRREANDRCSKNKSSCFSTEELRERCSVSGVPTNSGILWIDSHESPDQLMLEKASLSDDHDTDEHLSIISLFRIQDTDLVLLGGTCGGAACWAGYNLILVRLQKDKKPRVEEAGYFLYAGRDDESSEDMIRRKIRVVDDKLEIELGEWSGRKKYAIIGSKPPVYFRFEGLEIHPLAEEQCNDVVDLLKLCSQVPDNHESNCRVEEKRKCRKNKSDCLTAEDLKDRCAISGTEYFAQIHHRTLTVLSERGTGLNKMKFDKICKESAETHKVPDIEIIQSEICSGADPKQWNPSALTEEVAKPLREACDLNKFDDCFKLALAILEDDEGNRQEAMVLLKKACDGSILDSCDELATQEQKQGNDDIAFELRKKACDGKISSACLNLAEKFERRKNIALAEKYYIKDCASNNFHSCAKVSSLAGSLKNVTKQRLYTKKACDGDPGACFDIAWSEEKAGNLLEAKKHYKRACQSKNMNACEALGSLEYTQENFSEAAKFLKIYCEDSDFKHESSCLKWAISVLTKNEVEEAARVCKKLCRKNIMSGCYLLGGIEESKKNIKEAKRFFKKACNKNMKAACDALGKIEKSINN